MNPLTERVALVTGGGSGMGLAIAGAYLDAGAKVAVAGRDGVKLRAAADSLKGGENLVAFAADVSDPEQARELVEKTTTKFGRVDILVNNAGVNVKARTMRELSVEDWQYLVRVNLDGAFYCIRAVLPQMLARKDGLIINISSVAGKRASPLSGAGYAASKFGMGALGLCLAAEEKDANVRVCNIYPGEVDTPILAARPTPVTAEQRKLILQPEDIAAAALFVATMPARVSIPELVIKPTAQLYF
jgi:NADP-dependent 3-hydroxy acid dehydrogenase YdfG